ncbi:MAG TPA: hypothetical protein VKB80_13635 [Kofleriaceae bacterium]|nr:hypothetical protein [Kofleriaceae bacterium]
MSPALAAKPLILLGALALAATGCGPNSDQKGSAAADQPAGKVVDLSGAVEAAREGGKARALTSGDSVYRDDTVTTGPDGAVTILLAHNQARWSLTAGRSRRVDRSAAWRAEAGSGSASAFDDDSALPTSSAGRHSEPTAGDTQATAAQPAPAPADETRVAEAPPPPRESSGKPHRRAGRKLEQPASGGGGDDGVKSRGIALGEVPAAPAPGGASEATGGAAAEPPLAVPGDERARLGALAVSGSRGKKELGVELASALGEAADLCARYASQTGDVAVAFDIGRKGDVAAIKVSGPRRLVGKVGACLRKRVEELSFPARREGTTHVRQTIRFEVP